MGNIIKIGWLNITKLDEEFKQVGFGRKYIVRWYNFLTTKMSYAEKQFLLKVLSGWVYISNNILRPLILGVSAFYVFNRIRTKYGIEQVLFIFMVGTLLLLRNMSSKISKLVD